MSLQLILCILAGVCFALDALGVAAKINWTPAGFCLLTFALFVI